MYNNLVLFNFVDNVFSLFGYEGYRAWLAMYTSVGLLALLTHLHLAHFLCCIVDGLGQMTMALDALDLRKVLELFFEFGVVVELVLFAPLQQAYFFRCICLPKSDIHFVACRYYVLVVERPFDIGHMLHALCVVHLG
jgi:hypothetical protein